MGTGPAHKVDRWLAGFLSERPKKCLKKQSRLGSLRSASD
jgi:hypothetical protein